MKRQKPNKYNAKAHKKRAQGRKAALGGLAAFAPTNPGRKRQRVTIHIHGGVV